MEDGPPIAILAVDDEPGVLALVRRCLDGERVTFERSLERPRGARADTPH